MKRRHAPEKPKLMPTSVLIPEKVLSLLRAEAQKQEISVSALIRRVVKAWYNFHVDPKRKLTDEDFK